LEKLTDSELLDYHSRYQEGASKSKRFESVKIHSMDTKFGYHVVRLLLEVEQIMAEGDLDLMRNREQLKDIRDGNWSLEEVLKWASDKERALERLYETSDLPYGPDEPAIKAVLLKCLEMQFGTLDGKYHDPGAADQLLKRIGAEIASYQGTIR